MAKRILTIIQEIELDEEKYMVETGEMRKDLTAVMEGMSSLAKVVGQMSETLNMVAGSKTTGPDTSSVQFESPKKKEKKDGKQSKATQDK
jgi:hypothetical protein